MILEKKNQHRTNRRFGVITDNYVDIAIEQPNIKQSIHRQTKVTKTLSKSVRHKVCDTSMVIVNTTQSDQVNKTLNETSHLAH